MLKGKLAIVLLSNDAQLFLKDSPHVFMLVVEVELEIVLEFVKFFGGAIGIVSHVI
jgi:hypothetical protein